MESKQDSYMKKAIDAENEYIKAISPTKKAYQLTEAKAMIAYRKAIAPAGKAYQEAIKKARKERDG